MHRHELEADHILARSVEGIGIAGHERLDGLEVALLVKTVAYVLLGGQHDELAAVGKVRNTHQLAAVVGTKQVLRVGSVLLESDDNHAFTFAPVIIHVTDVIADEHLDVLLALEGTRHVAPHIQQFLADIGKCQLTGSIHITFGTGDVPDSFAFSDNGTDTVERVLNVRLFFIRTVFCRENGKQQVIGCQFMSVVDQPQLERVFLAECTGNLGDVGTSVALRLVGHLHYNGTHNQTSGNNLAQILSGSELAGVLAGDASALHLAQFKGVGNARYRSEMSQHLRGVELVDRLQDVLVLFYRGQNGGNVNRCFKIHNRIV